MKKNTEEVTTNTIPKPDGFIAFDEISIAEALQQHDYKTVHIGKWHLQNHTDKGTSHFPENHGFDINRTL